MDYVLNKENTDFLESVRPTSEQDILHFRIRYGSSEIKEAGDE